MTDKPIVAHIHPSYLGLSETFIHRFVEGLTDWQSMVLTEQVQNSDYYEFGKRYPVFDIGRGLEWPFHVRSKYVRMTKPSATGYFSTHARYSKVLDRINPALLHAHFGPTGWFVLPLKHLYQLPMIVSFHGYDASKLLGEDVWQHRYQELFASADAFTTPSMVIARRLEEFGCPRNKLHVIHCGIDMTMWRYRPPTWNDHSKSFNVLVVARLVEKKGIIYALRAIAEMLQSFPNVHVQIAGEGNLRPQIETAIVEYNLGDHVDLSGFVPSTQVRDLMQNSDVLLAPSVTAADGDEEGLPVVLIEAAAIGLPIVTTRHAGAPELIQDGESGFLVDERNSHALAQCLITLATNPELHLSFADAARRTVEAEFDLYQSIAQLEQLYDQVRALY